MGLYLIQYLITTSLSGRGGQARIQGAEEFLDNPDYNTKRMIHLSAGRREFPLPTNRKGQDLPIIFNTGSGS
jgi:hypothetical protein